MSAEQLPQVDQQTNPFMRYAESALWEKIQHWHDSRADESQPILLNTLFQKLCAESLVNHLRQQPHLQKIGGKTLEAIMVPTDEPHMYYVGLQIRSPASLLAAPYESSQEYNEGEWQQ